MIRYKDFGFNAARHERRHPWWALGARLLLCLLFSAGMSWFGRPGLLLSLVLWAYVFSPVLLELLVWCRRGLKAMIWSEREGQHYVFKGVPLRIEEDVDGRRWIHLEDFARALQERPRESALRAAGTAGLQVFADGTYLLDETAITYLAARSTDRAARLKVWVERTVWHPSRKRRR